MSQFQKKERKLTSEVIETIFVTIASCSSRIIGKKVFWELVGVIEIWML